MEEITICPYCSAKVLNKTKSSLRGHISSCIKYHEAIKNLISKEFLEENYVKKGISVNKIRKILKEQYNLSVTAKQVEKKLKEYNIYIRNITESAKMQERNLSIQKTCLEKYGDTNVLGKKSIYFQKRNETVLKKYGVQNVFQTDFVKEKIKLTCLEKYGF